MWRPEVCEEAVPGCLLEGKSTLSPWTEQPALSRIPSGNSAQLAWKYLFLRVRFLPQEISS